tara:strand:- start:503 stop:1231 length:729 start_codon:yes stop_codon:yes gene_type:complete
MAGTGYFDKTSRTYKSLPTETWASYTNWSTFTSWAGTPSASVSFTTPIRDAGKIANWNPIVNVSASIPPDITIFAGSTLESTGQIDIASTTVITPGTDPVNAVFGRYFQFKITLNKDSATQNDPEIAAIDIDLTENTITINQSDIDTSTLGGSVGQRNLTFNQNIGKLTSVIVQPHYTGLDDSAGDKQTPIVYIDKTSTPTVLNIFNIDTYGKRTRMDCIIDVQATGLPKLVSDDTGIREDN